MHGCGLFGVGGYVANVERMAKKRKWSMQESFTEINGRDMAWMEQKMEAFYIYLFVTQARLNIPWGRNQQTDDCIRPPTLRSHFHL